MSKDPPGDDQPAPTGGQPDFDGLFFIRDGEDDGYRWFTPRLAARLWLALELIADERHLDPDTYEDRLPPIALARGPELAARLSQACADLRGDIERGEPPFPRCTGESVVLGWALGDARDAAAGEETTVEIAGRLVDPLVLTDEDSADPVSDLTGLYDALFQDLDFETLYDPELDGVDASEHGRQLGMESLRPADWFIPYNNVGHLTERTPST